MKTLRFPYKLFNIGNPIWSLDGRVERPRSVVDVTVIGPIAKIIRASLLDTGGDDTVFPLALAARWGST